MCDATSLFSFLCLFCYSQKELALLTSRKLMPLLKISLFSWFTVLKFLSVAHKKCLKAKHWKNTRPFFFSFVGFWPWPRAKWRKCSRCDGRIEQKDQICTGHGNCSIASDKHSLYPQCLMFLLNCVNRFLYLRKTVVTLLRFILKVQHTTGLLEVHAWVSWPAIVGVAGWIDAFVRRNSCVRKWAQASPFCSHRRNCSCGAQPAGFQVSRF